MSRFFTRTSRVSVALWVRVAVACAGLGLLFIGPMVVGAQAPRGGQEGQGEAGRGGGEPAAQYIAPTKPAVHMNKLIERLEQGYAVFGGIDFQWVDQEHG